jgi:hypothetical protein
MSPTVVHPLPDITLRDVAGETAFYIGDVFFDADGDEMNYEISVASNSIATARIKDDWALIKPVEAGVTTLTLSADDGNTGRNSFSLPLTITANQAPEISGLISDATLIPFSDPLVIRLSGHASEPDGDPLHFYAQADEIGTVNVTVEDDILTIAPLFHGEVDVQVTASDPYSARTSSIIRITVEQKYAPEKTDQLLIYPNPVNDILWYSFILNEPASVNIRIVNSAGQIMFQTPAEKLPAATYYRNINLQGRGIGMYFIQLIKDEKVLDMKKFVKQ